MARANNLFRSEQFTQRRFTWADAAVVLIVAVVIYWLLRSSRLVEVATDRL